MTIRRVTAELFHADGRTDRYEEAVKSFAILRTRLKMDFKWTRYECDDWIALTQDRTRLCHSGEYINEPSAYSIKDQKPLDQVYDC